MRYPILIHPNDKLKRPAQPIDVITDETIALLDNLYETMIANDGIGIAAPQVGQNKRIALIEVDEGEKFELINPEIIEAKGESMVTAFGYLARAFQHEIDHLDGILFIEKMVQQIPEEELEEYMEEHLDD